MNRNIFILPVIFLLFIVLEMTFPLRKRTFSFFSRAKDNLLLTLIALPFTRFLFYPLYFKLDHLNQHGISEGTIRFILSFLLLDYLLYWWHRVNHRYSFLWRFHQIHHTDVDMDASTALRFHFGELCLSGVVRLFLIFLLGFKLEVFFLFDLMVTSLTIFHHSNLRLPKMTERALSFILVTPLYHQTHHSYFQNETDSNFSTIFNWWDRLHGTYTGVRMPEEITIGLPAFPMNLSLGDLLKGPFLKHKKWPEKYLYRNKLLHKGGYRKESLFFKY